MSNSAIYASIFIQFFWSFGTIKMLQNNDVKEVYTQILEPYTEKIISLDSALFWQF